MNVVGTSCFWDIAQMVRAGERKIHEHHEKKNVSIINDYSFDVVIKLVNASRTNLFEQSFSPHHHMQCRELREKSEKKRYEGENRRSKDPRRVNIDLQSLPLATRTRTMNEEQEQRTKNKKNITKRKKTNCV